MFTDFLPPSVVDIQDKEAICANLGDHIAQVNHPTLILWGEADDVLGTEDATMFEQAILGSQLIWIQKAGHVPHFDQPQSVAAHVLTFARRIGN